MAWYGEISVSTVLVSWGAVAINSDFNTNSQTGITLTYICNGSYQSSR